MHARGQYAEQNSDDCIVHGAIFRDNVSISMTHDVH